MKWILRNALIVAVIATGATPGYAKHHAIVLAGLDAAKHYHGKSNRHVYIRAASFSRQSNAKQLSSALKSRIKYPVNVAYKHGYYAVTIGPVASAAATRQIGETIPADLKMPASKHNKHQATKVIKPVKPAVLPVNQTPKAVPAMQPVESVQTTASKSVIISSPVTKSPKTTALKKVNKPVKLVRVIAAPEPIQYTSYPIPLLPADWSGAFFISAGAGDMFNRVEGDNSLGTGAGWPPDHYVSNGISDQPFFALSGGYTWARPNDWLPYYSLGLKLMYVSTSTVSGYIDQYSLPTFRNYDFKYDVQLLNVMATAKVDLYRWKDFMPYLTGGLGLTNYYTSQYSETATSGVTPRVSPGFGDGSGNNFSYTLGVGVDYVVKQNLWVNLEVNYNSFGNVGTDNGQNYATLTGTNYDDESLKNSISATSVFLGLTYYVG